MPSLAQVTLFLLPTLRCNTNDPANNSLDEWLANGIPQENIRKAIGEAAKEKGWFKRMDHGEDLGRLIIEDLPNLAGKETLRVLEQIEDWVYG